MPIDRDAVTKWSLVRGSSFKGVWADYYGATDNNRQSQQTLKVAFGYQPKDGTRAHASPLLQDTVAAQDFFEKTRVQGGGEAFPGNAVLGRVSLQE